ncbi:hypothetical protein D3C80_1559060 [compost metagenome]
MEQEHFTRLHLMGLAQQIMHRQPFQEGGRALLKTQVMRQQCHFFLRNVVHFAVGSKRRLGIHHPVTRF